MSAPLVSIIIPFYNRREFITETVDSVQAQTFKDWEIILIDDGSTDGSYPYILQAFGQDPRIKIVQRKEGLKGANRCRNIGIREARGEYLIFLDSDDLLSPNCLERRVRCFQDNTHCDFLVFNTLLFKERTGDYNYLWNIDSEEDDVFRFLRQDVVWHTSGPIHKKDALRAHQQFFDETLPFWQDFEFHTRYLLKKPVFRKFLDLEPDHYCRRHSSASISQKGYGSRIKDVQKTKQGILDSIYKLIQTDHFDQREYKANLAASYILIGEEAFRHKLVAFSYAVFTRLWLRRFITFTDYIYLLIKQPLCILKIRNAQSALLNKWEEIMKAVVSKKIMFPKHNILQVEYKGNSSFS